MRADKVSAALAAVIATAAVALTAVPSAAEPTDAPVVRPVRSAHPPARVTVRKRSYLDPGTETKHRTDYYSLYSTEYGMAPRRDSTLFMNGPSLPFIHDRMPFPTCLDLGGFCREP